MILPCACFEGQHYSGIIWGQGCLFSHRVDKEGHIHNGNTIKHQQDEDVEFRPETTSIAGTGARGGPECPPRKSFYV